MAYAAVISAKKILERLISYPSISEIFLPISELKSICDELRQLESLLLKRINSIQSSTLRAGGLERQIQDIAEKLEDVLISHASDRPLSESARYEDGSSYSSNFSQELIKVKQEISSLAKGLENEKYCSTEEDQQPPAGNVFDAASSSTNYYSDWKYEMVGLDDEQGKLLDWLLSDSKKLEISSVVGMAGIGKTTLVKNICINPKVVSCFRHVLFLTIGPNHNVRKFLLLALKLLGEEIDEKLKEGKDDEIGLYLYQRLFDYRYAIILDDVWSIQFLDKLRKYFPDEQHKSRIILTTRLAVVARQFSSHKRTHKIRFLNKDESWDLLRKSVFTTNEGSCPPELDKLGKKIAKKCDGLPMAIIVVGDRLREAEKTVKYWEKVAEDEASPIMRISDDVAVSKSLSLSYEMLPEYLKPIFLYIGVFPPKYEILVSELMKLWVAEGFIVQMGEKSLNDMAEECLNDLVSRSVVLVSEECSRGGMKTCRVHFVFRNLCVSEAEKQKFFHIINNYAPTSTQGTNDPQRLCIHNNIVLGIKEMQSSMESFSSARSLLCYGPQHRHPLRVFLGFRRLRILNALTIRFYEFPDQVLELVRLRYLAITYDEELPKSISRLWNLEVLIVGRHDSIVSLDTPAYLPMEIWKLHWLTHLHCIGHDLPDPSTGAEWCDNDSDLILENLLTLSGVSARSCTRGVLARIPNLVKLGIQIELPQEEVETFSFLGEVAQRLLCLESFKCVVVNPRLGSHQLVSSIPAFPDRLKKITLSGCGFSWEDMAAIGRLPNLQVLKLRCHAFSGPVWEVSEDEFPQLEYLLLEDLDIQFWNADPEQFKNLNRLIFRHCYNFEGIPLEFGDIGVLEMIDVIDCSSSLVDSAMDIEEDQRDFRKCSPVFIHSSWS